MLSGVGEPVVVDFQNGAMAGPNSAIDQCEIQVIAAATFTELTFRNNYDETRVVKPSNPGTGPGEAIGSVAPDPVVVGISWPATQTLIKGVKSYQLASGTIIVYHKKN